MKKIILCLTCCLMSFSCSYSYASTKQTNSEKYIKEVESKVIQIKGELRIISDKIESNKTYTKSKFNKIINENESFTNDITIQYENLKNTITNNYKINNLQKDFEALKNDYNSFKSQTNGVLAGVAAMGQLAQPHVVGNSMVGVGFGLYEGSTAIAVGVGYRYTKQTTFRGAVSANSGSGMKPVIAASMNYEW